MSDTAAATTRVERAKTFFWAIAGFVAIGLITRAVLSFLPSSTDRIEEEKARVRLGNLQEMQEAQAQLLVERVSWINEEKGTVALPIAEAMKLTLKDYPAAQRSDQPIPGTDAFRRKAEAEAALLEAQSTAPQEGADEGTSQE